MNLLDLVVRVICDDSDARSGIESVSSWTIAKGTAIGQTIANAFSSIGSAITGAFRTAASKVVEVGQSALNAYKNYEQLKGGIETLYKNGSDAVMSYAKNAYKTAGMSANQYMETATSFASSLVSSLAKRHQETVQVDIEAERAMLDQQLANEKAAMEAAYKERQRIYSHEQTDFKRLQEDELEEYQDSLSEQLAALKDKNDQEVKDTEAAQRQQVKDFEDATNAKIRLMEQEYNESLRLIDEELYQQTKAIDDRIDSLNAQTDAERAEQKRREQQERESELRTAVLEADTDEKKQKAQKELNDYIAKVEQERREESRKREINSLKEQKDNLKTQAQSRKDALKKQYDEELQQYKDSRAAQKAEMERANADELEAMRKANDDQYNQQKEENERLLKEFRRRQDDEMTKLRESQQDQLAEFKAAQDAQYQALKNGADERIRKLEEEANAAQGFAEATEEDYVEAARITNVAITDMADNANKYGTAMESLQYAYQGFAKDNFTMLDNLKLGYGGTRSEMERLLDDAEGILAKQGEVRDFSIDSFADIVEAIHVVQQQYEVSGYSQDELAQKLMDRSLTEQEVARVSQDLGLTYEETYQKMIDGNLSVQDAIILTGTTSYEASQTIEGSLNSLQGAWENWLVSLASDDMNVKDTTDKLVDAAIVAMENIIPRVGVILGRLAIVVAEKGPEALAKLKEAFLNSLPPEWREKIENFGKKVDEFIKGLEPLRKWLEENIPKAMEFLGGVFDSFTSEDGSGKAFLDFLNGLGTILKTVGDTFYKIGNNIGVCLADLVSGFEGTENVGGTVFYNIGKFFHDCGETFDNVKNTIQGVITDFTDGLNGAESDSDSVFYNIGKFFHDCGETFERVKNTIQRVIDDVRGFFDGLGKGVDETIGSVIGWFENLPQNILDALGNLGKLLWDAGADIINGFWDGLSDTWGNVQEWVGGIGDWIQNNKGPKQYDLGLLVNNGQWIMSGLEKGLRDQFPAIEDAIGDLNGMLADAGGEVDMSLTSHALPAGTFTDALQQSSAMMPLQIVIQQMNVNDENDAYAMAHELDRIYRREMAGALL